MPNLYVCLLKKFNNYFNRIIKGYDALEDYESAVGADSFYIYENPINFNYSDNVSTELIMNDCPFEADYLLLLDDEQKILSRWFILETVYTRNKQYKYSLRRDLIFDFKENLKNSPAFIQKAMLSDADPFIFNSEGMSFNQIKKSETLLKDKTNSAWIVGYIARNAAATDVTVSVPDEDFKYKTINEIATAMGISEANLASLLNFDGLNSNVAKFTNSVELRWGYYNHKLFDWNPHRIRMFFKPDFSELVRMPDESVLNWTNGLFRGEGWVYAANLEDSIIAHKTSILSSMNSITSRIYLTSSQLEILRTYLNEAVYYNGEYYKLSLNITGDEDDPRIGYSSYNAWPSIATAVTEAAANTAATAGTFLTSGTMAIFTKSTNVYIQLQKISDESGVIKGITSKVSSARRILNEQVFDMFAIPYGEVVVRDSGYDSYTTKADAALSLAAAIAEELDASCYDVQLLPYCPVLDMLDDEGRIDITAATEDKEYSFIDKTDSIVKDYHNASVYLTSGQTVTDTLLIDVDASDITDCGAISSSLDPDTISVTATASGTQTLLTLTATATATGYRMIIYWWQYRGTQHYSIILWANKNNFSTLLDYPLNLVDSVKIDNECNKYRLVSPNYQGSFDFSLAKNGGSVPYFIAECTYRPYTPYLKIAPFFSYLYGTNFGDCRGLICGGDFSLPRFTSAWESYELNNKNYQNIFNRDVQNLDLEQSLTMRQQLITGALGIVGAGAVGAGAGLKATGSPYGAIAGAAVGLTGSAIGMGVDVDILGKRQKEARDYSIDKFNYQLGNIKALPYTLTKVGSFDINSKIWPFLEFYTCTDEEKEALQNKIHYESMTVMRIGYIGEYISISEPHYLKCELIRNEEIAEDNHIFEAIYSELAKGVYI